MSACSTTQPLISHAHIGHAITSWHDTPNQEGLYTVAAKELDTAIDAVADAIARRDDVKARQRALENVLHALNPDLQRSGPGLDYGALRALTGAIEHLEFAANSPDASPNFVDTVLSLADQGDLIVRRLAAAADLSHALAAAETAADIDQLQAHLLAAKFGSLDVPTYGDPGLGRADQGLVHVSSQLAAMLERESNPAYEPVPKRYVLGLVRLPNGLWGYRLKPRVYSDYGYVAGY